MNQHVRQKQRKQDVRFQELLSYPYVSGSLRLRENLENLEKLVKFGKLRENLENSGNFETFCLNSGKTQGIL